MNAQVSPIHANDAHGAAGLPRTSLPLRAAICSCLNAAYGPGALADAKINERFARLANSRDPAERASLEAARKFGAVRAANEINAPDFPDSPGVGQAVAGLAALNLLGQLRGAFDMTINTVVPAFGMGTSPEGEIHQAGRAIRLVSLDYTTVDLTPIRAAVLVALSLELIEQPKSEPEFRRRLLDAVTAATNREFLSLAHDGASAFATGATAPNELLAQAAGMTKALAAAGADPRFITLAASPATLLDLATAQTTFGTRAFPEITVNGGTLAGMPLVPALGIDAGELHAVAGDAVVRAFGVPSFHASKDGQLEMASDPSAQAQPDTLPVAGSKQRVNLWQAGMIGLRVIAPFAVDFTRDTRSAFITGIDLSADTTA